MGPMPPVHSLAAMSRDNIEQSTASGRMGPLRWLAIGAVSLPFVAGVGALVVGLYLRTAEPPTDIGGRKAPQIGETMFVGRGSCDNAVKLLLRDPGSFQRISTQIVDVKRGEGWVARVDFRSRNGFGGYGTDTAYCVFDGRSYRALFDG